MNLVFLHLTPASTINIDSFSFHNFFQYNHIINSSGNIVDLVLSSSNELLVFKATSPLIKPNPYHPSLFIQYNCPKFPEIDITRTYFDFKVGEYSLISHFVNSFNWELTFSLYSANDAVIVFNDALLNSFHRCIPKKNLKISKFPHWVSSSLKRLINQKKRAHKIYKQPISPSG